MSDDSAREILPVASWREKFSDINVDSQSKGTETRAFYALSLEITHFFCFKVNFYHWTTLCYFLRRKYVFLSMNEGFIEK